MFFPVEVTHNADHFRMLFRTDQQKHIFGRAVLLGDRMDFFHIRTGAVHPTKMRISCGVTFQFFPRFARTAVRADKNGYGMFRVGSRREIGKFRLGNRPNAAQAQRLVICFVVNQMTERADDLSRPRIRKRLLQPVGCSLHAEAKPRVACDRYFPFRFQAHFDRLPSFSATISSIRATHSSMERSELSTVTASGAATAGATVRVLSLWSRRCISARTSS